MSLTELGNRLVTQNSIKTDHEYSFKNPICCLYRQILPKFWDNMFRVQNIMASGGSTPNMIDMLFPDILLTI